MVDSPEQPPQQTYYPKATFKGKTVNVRRDILWAAEHVLISDVSVKNAPSAFAWGQLQWARENSQNRSTLYQRVLALIGKEDDDGLSRKIADDGRSAEQLIEEIRGAGIHSLLSDSEQGSGGESDGEAED